jgi:pyruvate dehydrogenase E2 component (dihydrolipoamide acetyltransferase)
MNGFLVCSIISLIIYTFLYDWTFIFLFLSFFSAYLLLERIFVPESARKINNLRRKLAIATWSDPDSPECHGHMKVKMTETQEYIEKFFQETGKRLTITQVVIKACADVLADYPDITGKLVFGYYVPYETVDISCLVSLEGDKDLSFICYSDANRKTMGQIWDESQEKLKSIRTGDGLKMHKKASSPFKLLPTALGGILIEICSFLAIPLGIDLPMWGIKRHPCGSLIITNVGNRGFDIGYAPFPTVVRVPAVFALSSIKVEPVVHQGCIETAQVLTILFTLDHRFGDGTRALKALNQIKEKLENPFEAFSFN